MRTLVAGSRTITDAALLDAAMADACSCGLVPTEIISGGARGVDRLAEGWARRHRLPIRIVVPNWKAYGRAAGVQRNWDMVRMADVLIAVHCGTPGTQWTIGAAHQRGLPVYEYRLSGAVLTPISRPEGVGPQRDDHPQHKDRERDATHNDDADAAFQHQDKPPNLLCADAHLTRLYQCGRRSV